MLAWFRGGDGEIGGGGFDTLADLRNQLTLIDAKLALGRNALSDARAIAWRFHTG